MARRAKLRFDIDTVTVVDKNDNEEGEGSVVYVNRKRPTNRGALHSIRTRLFNEVDIPKEHKTIFIQWKDDVESFTKQEGDK